MTGRASRDREPLHLIEKSRRDRLAGLPLGGMGGLGGSAVPRLPTQKTVVIELFVDLFLQTDGTTSYVYVELDRPELEELGPYIESMYLMTVTHNRTTGHNWTVGIIGSNTGRTWTTPVAIATDISANGEVPTALYRTQSTWAYRRIKALAACKNTGAGSRESASVSAWLVVNLKT
jgi:hypothetical protein